MKKQMIIALVTCAIVILVFGISKCIFHNSAAKEHIKVGFVYISDESTAYSSNIIDAANAMANEFGDKVTIRAKYNVPEKSAKKYIKKLADEKCNIIFTTSYGYGEATKELAKEYPDIQFCQATCSNANDKPVLSNYHTFMGRIYEGRYVSGVVAGMKLKELIELGILRTSKVKIGYVGAFNNPEVISGFTAFFLGVRSCVPEAKMIVKYAESWSNYAVEKRLAETMISEGCVLISQHSDTQGPAVACEEASQSRTIYHVGYNQSFIDVAPTTSLAGTRMNWKPYITSAVQAVLDGENIENTVNGSSKGNDCWAGFDEDWVQMLPYNDLILAKGTMERVQKTIQDFKAGKNRVFWGAYTATDPDNPKDKIDLRQEYKENKDASAPSFHYILDNAITIEN